MNKLYKSLAGTSVEYYTVRNRKAVEVTDKSIALRVRGMVQMAIDVTDDSDLRFALLHEIYRFYIKEPFYNSIVKKVLEGMLSEKGLLGRFTDYCNHIEDGEEYQKFLRGVWTTYPQKNKPAALLETFRIYFIRNPKEVNSFRSSFTASDRVLLNL